MQIEIKSAGLDYLEELLRDQRSLIDALEKNAHDISDTITLLNAKEIQPSAATDG